MLPQLILELNTRLWLRRLGVGPSPSFREVPDRVLDEWRAAGYDAIWLMGVWLPSATGAEIARSHPGLRGEYAKALPDWHEEDVGASPYAIRGYDVNPEWGGAEALQELRSRMKVRGLRLLLDFIPNHVARDHPWIHDHPAWFVQGTGEQFHHAPHNWFFAETIDGERIIAHGRDPYFDGWTDTAQLDYRNPELQAALRSELRRVATLCDGVRCDMAMLVTREVFTKTWPGSGDIPEFWPAAIRELKQEHPEFVFIAEVYWGLEARLRELGFDLTYDKGLLDRIVRGEPLRREQFDLPPGEHRGWLRFLENHDERRTAALFEPRKLSALATWVYSLPGSRLLFDGQAEGKRVRLPIQLQREPREAPDDRIAAGYARLMRVLSRRSVRGGRWSLLSPRTAWMGNETHARILGAAWDETTADARPEHTRVFVNAADTRSQCWVELGLGNLMGRTVVLRDQLSEKVFERDGVELMMRGFYLDLEPWESHAFDCEVRLSTDSTLS